MFQSKFNVCHKARGVLKSIDYWIVINSERYTYAYKEHVKQHKCIFYIYWKATETKIQDALLFTLLR